MEEKSNLKISVKCFVIAIAVIFALMVFTYILTMILPGGEYARTVNEAGNTIIDTSVPFKYTESGLPFWKFLLSPILVLTIDGGTMLIAIIFFLLVIGGVFTCLEKCSFMKYMLDTLTAKFSGVKYKFLAILILFFMLMGAFIGSFEEVVPLVPIVVSLAISLGWDSYTGVAMSLLATGCGFASGVCNPFTVGIAQRLASLPMFSGMWMRCISFVCIYALLLLFVSNHAKKIDSKKTVKEIKFDKNEKLSKAVKRFAIIIGIGICIVISSGFITALQDYTMIIVAVMFLVAGVVGAFTAGMKFKDFIKTFKDGAVAILPSVLMILMASSIKYILVEGNIQDTILHMAVTSASNLKSWQLVLFIYLIVLIMNFFVGSGSAKAFMMIPLLVPLANMFGISSQLCILAFAFGDGFSNVFYPTNAALLISLGLADTGYADWVKYSWKFQLSNFVLTSLLLVAAFYIGY